jgi:hypothetical protein
LASIHYLIITNVILKVLHDLDPQIKIMLGVAVDKLADVLALIRAFLDDVAVILEKMVDEELVEIRRW